MAGVLRRKRRRGPAGEATWLIIRGPKLRGREREARWPPTERTLLTRGLPAVDDSRLGMEEALRSPVVVVRKKN